MSRNERIHKVLSLLLALIMVLQSVPVNVFAATEENLCDHHAGHTAACGYVAAVAEAECIHVHDGECGYIEAVTEVICACEETDEGAY